MSVLQRVIETLATASSGRGTPYGWLTLGTLVAAAAVVSMVVRTTSRRAHLAAHRRTDEALASVSHELRTPLTSILGFAHMLRRADDLSSAERSEMLDDIVDEAESMLTLVEDLLTVTVLDRGADIHVAEGVVGDVAASVERVIRRSAQLRDAGIIVHGTAGVQADEGRLHQIVNNLLQNAVQHGEAPVVLSVEEDGAVVHITVRDGGRGIPDHIVQRMFDRHRSRPDRTVRMRSTGVGLWLSRELAERMGGELAYLGATDGTAFRLTLPAANSDQ